MAKKIVVTETRADRTTSDRLARDQAHADRLAERIKKVRPTSRVTTKEGQ